VLLAHRPIHEDAGRAPVRPLLVEDRAHAGADLSVDQDVLLPGLRVDDDRRRLGQFLALLFGEFDQGGLLSWIVSGARRLSNGLNRLHCRFKAS
jgi:hypothetical protein